MNGIYIKNSLSYVLRTIFPYWFSTSINCLLICGLLKTYYCVTINFSLYVCQYLLLPACRRPEFDPWVWKIPREGNATHPGTLAWKIPWTEKPGRLQSMGWQKSQTRLSNFTFFSVMFRFLSLFCMYGCCSVTQSCPTLCDPMD